MGQKPLFYIYGRKEMVLMVFLGLLVALFSFTLGIHLGKRVGLIVDTEISSHGGESQPHAAVETTGYDAKPGPKLEAQDDAVPDRLDLKEQGKNAEKVAQASLGDALHSEVARTGIQLETPRATDLPSQPKNEEAGATTTPVAVTEVVAEAKPETKPKPETPKPAPASAFSIQIGSYPNQNLAKEHLERLEALGVEPFMAEAEVQGKKWFRIYLGRYGSTLEAKKSADQLRTQRVIESFVISQVP